jgi:hypothetical protein
LNQLGSTIYHHIFIIVREMASILKRLGGLLPKRVQKVCISFLEMADGRDSWGMTLRGIVISNYQIQWVCLSPSPALGATLLRSDGQSDV